MAVTTNNGVLRLTTTLDTFGNASTPFSAKSITIVGDTTVTVGSVLTVKDFDGTVNILQLRCLTHDMRTIQFSPPLQFSRGIQVVISTTGTGPAGNTEALFVLA